MENKMSSLESKIVERFVQSQNSLVLQQSDLSLLSISEMVENGAIDVCPKYQRRERWSVEKESGLIESFLLNIPVPPIYLAEDEYGTYSVIDGKQRVTAIHKFLKGELKLKGLERFSEIEGYSFDRLPSSLSNALKIRPYLRVVTLLRQSDSELKHEVFLRLNKAGVALNSQEIRNVAFRGEFNDMLFKLSENPYINRQLKASSGSTTYREMIDVQYILRFFTIRESWGNFPGNMDVAMDTYMAFHYRDTSAQIATATLLFEAAVEFCESIWGDDGFVRPDGNSRALQGFYDIQMVCSTFLSPQERANAMLKKQEVQNALRQKLKQDEAFYESTTQFTSNRANVFYRINEFTQILKAI
jgi:hypothetical protein